MEKNGFLAILEKYCQRHQLLPDKDVDIHQGAASVQGLVLARGPQSGVINTPTKNFIQDPLFNLPKNT